MVIEKERGEKQKMENFLELKKVESKNNQKGKGLAEKQIHETLSYLSLNHNETILKKGVSEEEDKAIKMFEKKLNASIGKDEKKSLVSNLTGKESLISRKKLSKIESKITESPKIKTERSLVYEETAKRLGLSASSRKLI